MHLIEDLKVLVSRLQTETETLVALLVAVLALTVLYYFVFSFLIKNEAQDLISIFSLIMIISAVVILVVEAIANEIFLMIPAICIVIII